MKALVLKIYCSFFSLWPLLMLLTAVFVLQSEQDWRQSGVSGTLEISKNISYVPLPVVTRRDALKMSMITGEYHQKVLV